MTSNWKVLNTKFVQLIKIYNCCFGQLSIWDSLDGSNLWFLNFNVYKLVFGTLDCLKLKSFEYQVCSAHQDLQSLYILFFHLRKFEQNVVQISQVCDIVLENLYEIQEVVTSVWYKSLKWENELCNNCRSCGDDQTWYS